MEMAHRPAQRTLHPLMSALSLARSQRGKKQRAARKREEALHEIALRKASADFAEPVLAEPRDEEAADAVPVVGDGALAEFVALDAGVQPSG